MKRQAAISAMCLVLGSGLAFGQQTPSTVQFGNTTQTQFNADGITTLYDYSNQLSQFVGALPSVRDNTLPADVRTTAEQNTQIDAVVAQWREQVAAYFNQNRSEWLKLEQQLVGVRPEQYIRTAWSEYHQAATQARTNGTSLPNPPEIIAAYTPAFQPGSAEFNAAKTRLDAIVAGAPDPATFQNQIFAVLTPAQQTTLRERFNGNLLRLAKAQEKSSFASDVSNWTPARLDQLKRVIAKFNINNPAIPQNVRDAFTSANPIQQYGMMKQIETRLAQFDGNWFPVNEQTGATAGVMDSNQN